MKKILHAICMIGKFYLYGFFVQLLFFNLLYAESSNAQGALDISKVQLDLDMDKATLEEVFNAIKSKTEFTFIYDEILTEEAPPVSIKVRNKSLEHILLQLSRSHSLSFKQVDDRISVKTLDRGTFTEVVKEVAVNGTVVDKFGEPIPGVTVVIKGTTMGVSTDIDGKYSLLVPEEASLVYSFVGFVSQEINVGDKSQIDIILLEDLTSLDEVVVTALGIEKAEASLGYAVQEVKGKQFEKVKSDQFLDILNGKIAGLRVNSRSGLLQDPGISLRGRTPLYVVNGIPIRNSFRGIAPDDIEKITVLKGPQASVLYGSKGKDGAIVITTKSSGEEELLLSINSSTQVSTGYLTIPKVQTIYGQGEFGQYAYVDGKGGGLYDDIWVWGPKMDQSDPNTESGYWETPQYNSPVDPETGERIPTPWRSHPDNLKNLLRNGLVTNNNISVSQKIGKGAFNIGLNQMYRKGMIPNTDVNQVGVNMGGNYEVTDRLTFAANLNYSNLFTNNYPPVGYGNDQVYYNTVLYMGANNDIMDLKDYWVEGQEGYLQRNYNYAWFQNPWFLAYEYLRPYSKKRVIASASLDYKLGEETSLLLRLGNDYQFTNNEFKKPYAWVNGETGSYSKNTYDESLLDVTAIINSKKKFGDFGFDLMGGGNWNEELTKSLSGTTVGGLIVPDVYNFSNSKKQATVENWTNHKRMFGLFGSATVSWKESLFFGFTGRNDWSSALIQGNRSYFYPSVSSSIIASRLIRLPEQISFLKFRGSWARVGRDMSPYNLANYYYLSRVWGNSPSFAPVDRAIDPDIKPSMTDSYELGLDLRLFDDKVKIDFAYFNTLDKAWIQEVSIPSPSGYGTMLTNGNSYLRDGFEITLGLKPIQSKDLDWNISANVFKFKTVLYDIYNDQYKYGYLKVGDRTDSFFAPVYLKQPGTDNFVVDNNGLPIVDNFNRNLGNKDPKLETGLNNFLRYKKLSVDMQFTARFGGLIYSQLNARMIETGKDPRTATPLREEDWDKIPSYIPEDAVVVTEGEIIYNSQGDVISDTRKFAPSEIPVMFKDWMRKMGSLGGRMTEGWNVYDASFIKLRSVSLTYDLSDFVEETEWIKGLDVSLIGQNLWMWKKLPHEDPDGAVTTLGYPTERYVGLNFSVKF
ncbi:SusC/RagA family TonB-linked outer membrane protein [Echinicola salinicaeni]|uniref:SusC/RagA family TonB-linked outer membrane protein n=1 Tax=Echinicola salinicaeni TaxID=2762757 RepID=UPI001644E92B|nr:SusC/RagA family TonB-linked outer membrane protein [Echinicola salinicaeni]